MSRISVSNIAWERHFDPQVAEVLAQHGVDAIDVAPGRYFANPAEASANEVAGVLSWWQERGVQGVGLQALLFGTAGLNLFGDPPAQARMIEHLAGVSRLAAALGARRMTFGAPKNRDRSGWPEADAWKHAVQFFRRLG